MRTRVFGGRKRLTRRERTLEHNANIADVLKSLLSILLEALRQKTPQRQRRSSHEHVQVRLRAHHRGQDVGHIVAAKCLAAGERFVQAATKRPHIRALVDSFPPRLFRAHVRRGAHDDTERRSFG